MVFRHYRAVVTPNAAAKFWNLTSIDSRERGGASPMSPVQVVIDTDVLVSAWRSRNGCSYRLISSFIAGDDRWQWNVSTAALLEYEEVLRREGFRS